MSVNQLPFCTYLLTSLWFSVTNNFRNKCRSWEKKQTISWYGSLQLMSGKDTLTWKSYSIWSTESLQQSGSFSWPSIGAHQPVEQMYIATDFMTLVHSYVQVTARFDWLHSISCTSKFYEGNKKTFLSHTSHCKILKLHCKSKTFLPAEGWKPPFTREIIAKLLCVDNSIADCDLYQSFFVLI